ncbi:MAG: hypothetical protein H6828_13280 [Planctomycetes bacterium]|nr:hypothetical protein [Planctomycetota bacterium]
MARTLFPGEIHTGPWTDDEVQNLKRYIGVATDDIIARILGRSIADVQAQIKDLGRVHVEQEWSQQEIAELKRLYGTRVDDDIARIFGRKTEDVSAKAAELCLAKDKAFVRKLAGAAATPMPRWTADEIKLLEELYPAHSNLDIAKQLERSVKSVVSKAHNLGLKKDRDRLAEMGRQNVSLRYGRRADGTKDPDVIEPPRGSQSTGTSAASGGPPSSSPGAAGSPHRPAPEAQDDDGSQDEPPRTHHAGE